MTWRMNGGIYGGGEKRESPQQRGDVTSSERSQTVTVNNHMQALRLSDCALLSSSSAMVGSSALEFAHRDQ